LAWRGGTKCKIEPEEDDHPNKHYAERGGPHPSRKMPVRDIERVELAIVSRICLGNRD